MNTLQFSSRFIMIAQKGHILPEHAERMDKECENYRIDDNYCNLIKHHPPSVPKSHLTICLMTTSPSSNGIVVMALPGHMGGGHIPMHQ